MSDWPLAVDQLGAELERAIARRAQRSRLRRLPRLVPAAALALLIAAAAALATSGVIREGIPVPWAGGGKTTVKTLPLEPTRAADPAGGPSWGIRVSTSGSLVCATVGQVLGGRIGVVRERVFHALPATYHDSCARVPADGAVVHWAQYPGPNVGRRGARTVVYGVAGRGVVQVEVLDGDVSRTLSLSSRGAFVSAFGGLRSPRQLALRATRDNGRSTVYGGGG